MKYTTEITIAAPRDRVIALFADPAQMSHWQPGLRSYEPIEGEPRTTGAKMHFVYDENGRKMEITETVLKSDLPDEFHTLYETNNVMNWTHNRFYAEGDNTRWVQENEFKFSGMMMLIGFFMRGAFPKQTQKDMQQFKQFAEQA